MRKLLIFLRVIETIRHERGTWRRLNPYNPLSYLCVALVTILGFFMFGFVGFWKEIDLRNPFKWH
jgi:hypothetical protein